MNSCLYYQAKVERKSCWFLVAVLRSFEHLAFDRTLGKKDCLFEFFVPHKMANSFENLMEYFLKNGIVLDYGQLSNRLLYGGQLL